MIVLPTDETVLNRFLHDIVEFKRLAGGIPLKDLQAIKGAYKHKSTKHLLLIALGNDSFGKPPLTRNLIRNWGQANSNLIETLQSLSVEGVTCEQAEETLQSTPPKSVDLTGEETVVRLLSYVDFNSREDRERVYCALLLDPRENVRNLADDWGEPLLEGDGSLIKKAKNDRAYFEIEQLRSTDQANHLRIQELLEKLESTKNELSDERNMRVQAENQLIKSQNNITKLDSKVTELQQQLVAIQKKRDDEIREITTTLDETRKHLEIERRFPRVGLNPEGLNESWQEAVTSIGVELEFFVSNSTDTSHIVGVNAEEIISVSQDRESDWIRWQTRERELVEGVLWGNIHIKGRNLDFLEIAQNLLKLRWYLLQGLRVQVIKELSNPIASNTRKRRK